METKCNDADCSHPECDCWRTKKRFSQRRVVELELAIEYLIEVKDHKDIHGKDDWYSSHQPDAWKRARLVLKL